MRRSYLPLGLALAVGATLLLGGQPTAASAAGDAPVVLIAFENHAFGPGDPGVFGDTTKYIVGNTADAPYINNTLIPSGTLLTNYRANYHPSLPDYLELSAGSDGGCGIDSCPRDSITGQNLFHLMGQSGTSFTSISESMPANCTLDNTGLYLVRHNPEAYYTNLDASSGSSYGCSATSVPIAPAATPGTALAWPNPLPDFTFIAPNYCHEMHGSLSTGVCPKDTDQIIADGDTWLSANVPALLAQGAVVILTFDEGASGDHTGGGGHVPTIIVGPNVPAGMVDATLYTHAGLLAGMQDYFALSPLLGDAATAMPVLIPRATPYPTPTLSAIAPDSGAPGDQVTITGSGLTNAYAVRFAGTPASFSVNGDSSITASVPVGVQTGSVTVRTVAGMATSPDPFTATTPPPPAPALVQHAIASGVKSTQASVSWPQSTVAGDFQVATLGWSGGSTVTPPVGWALAVVSGHTAIYYRENAPAVSGPSTFSLSMNGNWVLAVSEWSGVSASGSLDGHAHKAGTLTGGTTAFSGTAPTATQPIELAIAAIRTQSTVTGSAPTQGFVQRDQLGAATNNTLGVYDYVCTVAAKRSTSVTLSAPASWHGLIATFRAA